ncbi:MAG TPA: late competence development ComFB family protein [Spirochaetota bacterium]|nr:late competence development ComFB family protein [Spirochaetota bacterium]
MEYFNLMELVVRDTVDEILGRDESLKSIKFQRNDIIAYVLNRIAPKYVTSERGIIHTRIENRIKFQEHSDILFLAYEAIDLFLKRRGSETGAAHPVDTRTNLLPYLIGEVLEETTLSIIPGLRVSLLHGESDAKLMEDGWKNPYEITKATRGYYHFWPEFDGAVMSGKDMVEFKIVFSHEKVQERTISVSVKPNTHNETGKAVSVPLVLLKLNEGITSDFLCS